ncbi:hypothetical protein MKZ38_001226 [Zalerion maritima]|uniref:Nephrocystin 3-like N-terminal domain-containing protein n=1 Tax=Zalerion maritima TaxID=339359 RepID=A0AAD5RFD5_9PEZI|nr:hypothetical protein MKZ38_001226 [Zalerion maritima]
MDSTQSTAHFEVSPRPRNPDSRIVQIQWYHVIFGDAEEQPRHPSNDAQADSTRRTQANPNTIATNLGSGSQLVISSAGCDSPSRPQGDPVESIATGVDASQTKPDRSTPITVVHSSSPEQNFSVNQSAHHVDMDLAIVSSDLWSAAYREAVDNLGKDIDVAILKGDNVAQLFIQLEEIDKEATQDSAFLRGVTYLHSLQVPLERFKLAVDLVSPLANIEPATATVFGVIRSVTAIAISFSTADLEFAKQIGEMLEQISYIDDCDTLGQKGDRVDIYQASLRSSVFGVLFQTLSNIWQALVLVYQKLLEFYMVAFEMLTRKGVKLVMRMILENDRLPNIVDDFLRHADNLRKLVQKATWEIVEDIKSMLYDHEISRWLGSEKTRGQSQYHASLQEIRADQACAFLLTDAEFISWYRAPDSQQLVLLGDMGYGKTVTMAFLVDELHRRNKHQLPQSRICYHYCQDDETGQAIYIFSSLILSLLEQLPGLKRTFFEWYKQAVTSGIEPATNMKKLEEFLQGTLETLDRPLFIIIDGLDECDRASRNTLLKSLKILSQNSPRLKILLSSRPQEEILEQLKEIPKIELGSNAERDRVIVGKAVETRLSYLTGGVRALVTDRLSRLAYGSAIWTKMIVELIEVRGIRALGPMRAFLEKLPQPAQLSELYVDLFSRYTSNDSENQKLAANALAILAASRRPLSILELSWAASLGAARKQVATVASLAELVDHQRVMSMIQPFIARVDFSDVKERQVTLVHQSAREFIAREWASNRPGLQGVGISTATYQAPFPQHTTSLEANILDICIKYLLLEEIGHTDLFSEEQVAIEELPQEFDLFSDNDEPTDYDPACTWEVLEQGMINYDPTERGLGGLFVYASCHWIEHFGAITSESLPDLGDIEMLCQAGSTRIHNWIKQNCRPDCVIKPRIVFDSSLYDPLSITLLYGSDAILRDMLENSSFDKDKFLPDTAMAAADQILQWGDLSRLRTLFMGSKTGARLRNLDFFRLVMKQWFMLENRHQDWDVAFDLVNDALDVMAEEHWGNEVLRVAASTGCKPITWRLMDGSRRNAALRTELRRAIGEGVSGEQLDAMEHLLGPEGIETPNWKC